MNGGPAGPWTHHRAAVGGLGLHYVRQGAGFPLLLLHGWPGFWYEWAAVLPALAAHHDVVAPDLPGFAYSDKPEGLPPEEAYRRDRVAEDVLRLADHLGWERFAVLAHDIGATVAQPLARRHPARVVRLVLLDPPYPGIGRRWREPGHVREIWYQIFHMLPWAPDVVGATRSGLRTYLRHFLTHWSARRDWLTDEELEHYVEAYSQPGALRGGFGYYRAFERFRTAQGDVPPEELAVRVPTLVLWGEEDPILPVAWADRLPEYFPQLSFQRVPGVGHFLMREDPERLTREVLAFLAPLRR